MALSERLRPYWLHLRPKSWAIVLCHFLVGYCVSGRLLESTSSLILAAIAWVPCLNGGTLAINSVFDKDEGNIGYLKNPPPVPSGLLALSILLLIAGQGLALLVNAPFAIIYGAAFIMSLLYSVPPVRMKAIPGADLLINAAGYGSFTYLAGYLAVEDGLKSSIVLTAAGFFFLFSALYPLTQIYQTEEDRRKGDRTLTVIIGERRALVFSLVAAIIAFAFLFLAAFEHGIAYGAIILTLAAVAWFGILIHWLCKWPDYNDERGMYRALWAWALTDIGIVLCFIF